MTGCSASEADARVARPLPTKPVGTGCSASRPKTPNQPPPAPTERAELPVPLPTNPVGTGCSASRPKTLNQPPPAPTEWAELPVPLPTNPVGTGCSASRSEDASPHRVGRVACPLPTNPVGTGCSASRPKTLDQPPLARTERAELPVPLPTNPVGTGCSASRLKPLNQPPPAPTEWAELPVPLPTNRIATGCSASRPKPLNQPPLAPTEWAELPVPLPTNPGRDWLLCLEAETAESTTISPHRAGRVACPPADKPVKNPNPARTDPALKTEAHTALTSDSGALGGVTQQTRNPARLIACENKTNDAIGRDPRPCGLSALALARFALGLSFPSNLFALHDGCGEPVRHGARYLAGSPPPAALSSVSRRRIRSGALNRHRSSNVPYFECQIKFPQLNRAARKNCPWKRGC